MFCPQRLNLRKTTTQLLAVAMLGGFCATPLQAALLVGAGTNLANATGREGTGNRLNIDDYNTQTLAAGTYTIDDFQFLAKVQATGSTNSGGSVVPFLAVFDGTQYRIIWRGTSTSLPTTLINNESAVVSGSTAGSFTLASDATIYSGFYTLGTAAVAYAQGYPEPRTDHANTSGAPTFANTTGNVITGITLTQQPRSYAHSLSVQQTDNIRIGPGLTGFLNADSADVNERLNIDRSKTLTLGAGTHTVSSFSFFSTLASGTTVQTGSVTPFLAKQTSSNQWEVVWTGSAVANSLLGGNEADLSSNFTLTGDATLYAGFFSSGGARIAYTTIASGDGTAHMSAGSFNAGVGNTLTFTSNANLLRTYSFELLVAAVPEPSRALLVFSALGLLVLQRRR